MEVLYRGSIWNTLHFTELERDTLRSYIMYCVLHFEQTVDAWDESLGLGIVMWSRLIINLSAEWMENYIEFITKEYRLMIQIFVGK